MKLTRAQIRMLREVIRGEPLATDRGLTRGERSGRAQTVNGLLRAGLIDKWHRLTDLGEEVVQEYGVR